MTGLGAEGTSKLPPIYVCYPPTPVCRGSSGNVCFEDAATPVRVTVMGAEPLPSYTGECPLPGSAPCLPDDLVGLGSRYAHSQFREPTIGIIEELSPNSLLHV